VLVTMKEILDKARAGGYGVTAPDVSKQDHPIKEGYKESLMHHSSTRSIRRRLKPSAITDEWQTPEDNRCKGTQ